MADVRLSKLIAPMFHDLHVDVKNKLHSEYWLMGGRGSTKSSFIALEIIMGIMKTPGANAIVYRKVANTLRESVYEQLTAAIDWLGVRGFFSFRVSPMEIRYKPTGQRIIFRGADDPSKSKSINLSNGFFGYLWFEETAEFQGMEAIRTIKASVIRGIPPGQSAITFYSYNPPVSARNWVNKEAMKEVEGRRKHKSCYLNVPREWLGKDFLAEAEKLKNSNERAYRHMYLGEVTGTGGNVFENISVREITQEEINQRGNLYSGIDWGWFPDPFHFVRCSYDAAQMRLWIWDEYRTTRTSNQDAFDYLAKNKGLTAGEEVIADSAENKSVSDMRSYGMRCVGAMKGPGSVRASMKWLQSLKEIIIDPCRCPNAADEFSAYEYEQNRDGEFMDAYPDQDNHAIDAVRYATNRIWMRAGA
jgi:PBSX family phage terminase large subunit